VVDLSIIIIIIIIIIICVAHRKLAKKKLNERFVTKSHTLTPKSNTTSITLKREKFAISNEM